MITCLSVRLFIVGIQSPLPCYDHPAGLRFGKFTRLLLMLSMDVDGRESPGLLGVVFVLSTRGESSRLQLWTTMRKLWQLRGPGRSPGSWCAWSWLGQDNQTYHDESEHDGLAQGSDVKICLCGRDQALR
jgi:hypothetical protein